MSPLRSRPEGCLSDFAFDRRLVGESGEEDAARLDAHVAQCARCARRLDELRAEQASFSRAPVEWKLAQGRPSSLRGPARGRGRWLGAASGVLALAAATLLWVRREEPGTATTRAKGGSLLLGVYVSHDGAVRAGGTAERVEPGDALRFVYTLTEPRHLAVLSLDGANHASVYYPDGATAAAAPRGSRIALPSSTVLDDVLGPEIIFGVACPGAFEVEPLRRELEVSGRVTAPSGCEVDTLSLRKGAR